MTVLDNLGEKYKKNSSKELTLQEYLQLCKEDPKAYANPHERLLNAIGQPKLVDTSKDPRFSRIYANRIIKVYECFNDFYGIEETIEQIVSFLKHAAQGLEEAKQILYLLGNVGSSKSTLVERLKQLMESQPFYAIKGSPVNDSPLCLFTQQEHGGELKKAYNIPTYRLTYKPSAWMIKRLEESNGDLSWIRVVKRYPSRNSQIAIARTEPGSANNQDESTLVGKADIRKLEFFPPNDPDAYSYSGGLCLANRGMLEFMEMFKAPLQTLLPLLSATQDRMFNGTQAISATPFEGIIVAHSNESEWAQFKAEKKNEAFLDRVCLIRVYYCLRINEEVEIYKKLLAQSELSKAPYAPKTLDLLATFSVISRLIRPSDQSDLMLKARVYNGENIKDKVNSPTSLQEYKKNAGVTEGMTGGVSPRFAFKVLSKTFNYDLDEIAANPIHLMAVLTNEIIQQQYPKDQESNLLNSIKVILHPLYMEHLTKEVQRAYIECYSEYGQNKCDKYIGYCECYLEDNEMRDPNTGLIINRKDIEKELETVERLAGISNVSDFRNEIVRFSLQYRSTHNGKNPPWTEYEKLREVIEKQLLLSLDQILPIISYGEKRSSEDEKKHKNFDKKMKELGYTEKQIKIVTEYLLRNNTIK